MKKRSSACTVLTPFLLSFSNFFSHWLRILLTVDAKSLPEDIIFDILSRLPAKSIGQFRCVSKQWCSLLSNPLFIRAHLHSPKHDEYKLICISRSHSLHIVTFNQNGTQGISRKLNFPQLSDNWVSVLGSCKGLILLINDEMSKFLINPTTLRYRRIPNFRLALPETKYSQSMYGFGYDIITDDYKVVTLSFTQRPYTFLDIYSVRKGLWRRRKLCSPCEGSLPDPVSGVLVNGALHWLVRKTPQYLSAILAFNLSEEKFLEVPLPDTYLYVITKLVALGGCLSMFTFTIKGKIDVWMMKNYGVKESWTKFSVTGLQSKYHFVPLCLASEDSVVLQRGGKLIDCNMKGEQHRNINVDGFPDVAGYIQTFKESLISPTLGGDGT